MNRREFLGFGLGAAGALTLPGCLTTEDRLGKASRFRGIQVGAITYSYDSMPMHGEDILATLDYCKGSGVASIELMGGTIESHIRPKGQKGFDVRAWREGFRDWGRLHDLRDRFLDAGIDIHIVKFGGVGPASDGENDFFCNVAKAFGARAITREIPRPEDWTKLGPRLPAVADRNEMRIAFHNHCQINARTYEGPLLGYSERLGINFDFGHYTAANDDDPLAVIRRFRDCIVSVHLKDRKTKAHGQTNMPWGQGDTPLGPLFVMMVCEDCRFNADVELEYRIPTGSDAVREVGRCVRYAADRIEAVHA